MVNLHARESSGAETAEAIREAVAELEPALQPPARPPSLLDRAAGFLAGLFGRRR